DEELWAQRRRNLSDRVMDRQRGNESEFRPMIRRRAISQQEAGEQIAGLRHPGAATTTAAPGLTSGGHPERAPLAMAGERQRLGIGRDKYFVRDQPHPSR